MSDPNHNRKLIVATAAVALLAGAGAAFAAMKLVSSHSSTPPVPVRVGAGGFGLGGRLGGRGFGGGVDGEGGHPQRGFGFGSFSAAALAPLTSYLGISGSTLQAKLGTGETLAQIAKAQGKSVAGLVTAMLARRKRQLEQEVSSGRLTAAQEQRIESAAAERMLDFVNGSPGGLGARASFGYPTA